MPHPEKSTRRLVPEPGFGQAVFELMKRRRRDDGTQWEAEDLGKAVGVSGGAVRDWIKGRKPSGERLARLAGFFQVAAVPLLEGRIEPINLPQDKPNVGRAYEEPLSSSVRITSTLTLLRNAGTKITRAQACEAIAAEMREWLELLDAISAAEAEDEAKRAAEAAVVTRHQRVQADEGQTAQPPQPAPQKTDQG